MSANGRPGILTMMGSLVRAPFAERMEREAVAENNRLALEASNIALGEVVKRAQPENDGFTDAMMGDGIGRELDQATAVKLREAALKASYQAPHMKGYLRSLLRYVMGQGPVFTPDVESEDTQAAMAEWWKRFREVNRWDRLEDEIPKRAWRDGEVFVRKFVQETEGPPVDWEPSDKATQEIARQLPEFSADDVEPASIPEGMVHLRLIPPDQIADPQDNVSHGILTSAKDVLTVLGYLWSTPDSSGNPKLREVIPAKDVLHIKIGVDQDVKRGRSILECLLKLNKQYEDWLTYRIMLNLARTAIVLIKRIEGTPGQVASIRDQQTKEREDGGNTRRHKALKPMSTIHASAGVSYEYLSPNLAAQDAQHDGRSILLSMGAGTGLPEFMFTGDASNANFASTMVAEGPAVREFQDWQDFFTPEFVTIYKWVMEAAAEADQVEGLTVDMVEAMDVTVGWPPLVSRNEFEHTKRNQMLHDLRVLSLEGIAEDEGIDHELESERVAKERADAVEFTAPMVPPEKPEEE